MKIILCTFLLCITAVSVFGKELNRIVGENLTFTAAVKKKGSLMYNTLSIGDVTSGSFSAVANKKFSSRLQWDSSTGLFSLSGLREEDSGEYKVQNTDQNINTVFQLNVYKDNVPVSKPHVSITQNEYPCTIECTAERGTGATLSWYREGEKKSLVSSRVASAPGLYLPAPVERSGTYTCEAKNSVSNEKASITVGAHCTAVFGQSVSLNGILGQSVEFPAAVEKGGSLMYSDVPIGAVDSGSFMTTRNENYRYRVQWDSSTGFFSLSGLKMEDSGEYKVQNTDQNIITVFQLNVYIPASKPHVSITHNEYPCTIVCTAERGTEATLSWYREGQTKPYSRSSVRSAPHLDLPQTVERGGTYTCEAKNSVSNEKASITVGDHCTAPTNPIMWILIAVVVLLLLTIVYFLWRRFIRRRRAVRTLIQVKKLVDNVDLHAYDETDHPDAVRPFILVKKYLYHVDQHAYVPHDAVRHFILVKKILRNVDPHECDGTVPPDAVDTFIQVKELLDNVDPHVCGFIRRRRGFKRKRRGETRLELSPDAVRTVINVKKLVDNLDLHAYGETRLELSPDGETRLELSPDAVRTVINVKKLLDNLDLHAYAQYLFDHENSEASDETIPLDVKELLDDVDLYEYVKKIPDNVDPHKYGDAVQAVPQSAGRSFIPVKKILDNVDPQQHVMKQGWNYPQMVAIYHPGATEKMASLHETEVPLKQVTCVVGEP